MKKVLPPTLKELFQYSQDLGDITKFHEEVKVYNPFTFYFFTTIALFIVGIVSRTALVLALSMVTMLLYEYFKLKKIAKDMGLKRDCPQQSREKEKIPFTYTLINGSSFNHQHFAIEEYFSGSEKGRLKLESPNELKANSITQVRHFYDANAGMGQHQAKELTLTLKDPLDLFKFKVLNLKEDVIDIYPKMESIIPLETPFDPYSYHFGEKDIPHRGDSINFRGVRQYRPGDPIRHINWRQSAKYGETIVNIFEKNINKTLTIIINRDERLHSGRGALSTFEYCKDFALALASQHISNGNEVRVLTNESHSPTGSGQSFINRLEFFLFELEPIRDPQANFFLRDVTKKHSQWSQRDNSLVYITPIVPGPLFEKNMEYALDYHLRGHHLQVFWVNAFPFLDQQLKYGSHLSVKHQLATTESRIEYWKKKAFKAKLPCLDVTIDGKEPFSKKVRKAKEAMWKA